MAQTSKWMVFWLDKNPDCLRVLSSSSLNTNLFWSYSIRKDLFRAKFIVSCCAYWKLRRDLGFFYSINILVKAGLMQITMWCACPAWLRMTRRLLKNSKGNRDGGCIFCWRKQADIALYLQMTKIKKIRKICEANLTSRLLPETGNHKATNLETWNKQNGTKSTNHKSQTMTFWTRTSKQKSCVS